MPSAREEIHTTMPSPENRKDLRPARPLSRTQSDKLPTQAHTTHATDYMVGRSNSAGHGPGPSSPLRSPAETAAASFPLNDIDYESSPAAVAQELSNLQAIRRMSMDVGLAGDPDLPSFSPIIGIPPMPPTDSTDEDDASRLFWVPARLHPELAPKEFKTFLDTRVDSMKRRSGEFALPADGSQRSGSEGGLRRKKSMLSRQIDNSGGKAAESYQDGAERLDQKRSQTEQSSRRSSGVSNLQELEMLMNDPSKVMQRLSLENKQSSGEDALDEDMPILPAAPGGNQLRRSTRTTYRKGSLRQGERLPPSKRAARAVESDSEDLMSPKSPDVGNEPIQGITRVQTEPTPALEKMTVKPPPENFSRPARGGRSRVFPRITSPPPIEISRTDDVTPAQKSPPPPQEALNRLAAPPVPPVPSIPPFTSREPKPFVSQIASNGRTTANIPSIHEPAEEHRPSSSQSLVFPDRKSSIDASSRNFRSSAPPSSLPPKRGLINTPPQQHNEHPPQTLQHMAAHPSPLPGNSTRTDSLSFIPTLTEDKRAVEVKKSVKKSSWSWGSLLGTEEKEKDRRFPSPSHAIDEETEIREIPRSKPKSKLGPGKSGDNTRLDVLQQTMDSSSSPSPRLSGGRESLVIDRGDMKLEEERKKESSRKSAEARIDGVSSRKDRDGTFGSSNSGLFSSLFGGKKKSLSSDASHAHHKKSSLRPMSPEPQVAPPLKPDVDYNWTRFSILEERAIYRMAHIKLANPRRALYSQVLLSNFMYSYLAKVQQMHPLAQIPGKPGQRAGAQGAAGQAGTSGGGGGSSGAAGQGGQGGQGGQVGGPVNGQGGGGGKKEEQPEEFWRYQRYQQV